MSFSEKVHNRLLALESQVQALDRRLKALEKPQTAYEGTAGIGAEAAEWVTDERNKEVAKLVSVKRGPGRPKKVVNG